MNAKQNSGSCTAEMKTVTIYFRTPNLLMVQVTTDFQQSVYALKQIAKAVS